MCLEYGAMMIDFNWPQECILPVASLIENRIGRTACYSKEVHYPCKSFESGNPGDLGSYGIDGQVWSIWRVDGVESPWLLPV